MNLANILKGTSIAYDAIQSIAGLTIVPLTCDPRFSFDDKYDSPYAHKVKTSTYGMVHLMKDSNKAVLVPPHSTYITKGYSAQDHLISKAALLEKSETILRDSRCVESTQPGLISASKQNEHVIAPLALREVAYNYAGQTGYDKLWNAIGQFNSSHNAGAKKQIKDYFTKWNKELDQFIAHFERIDNCIGFITLYKDEVVAIDKFPSFTYTSQIWDRLVRDSYASLVIKDRLSKTPVQTSLPKVGDIKDGRLKLSGVYERLVNSRIDHYKTLMQEVAEIEFSTREDSDTKGSQILTSEGYIGQVIDRQGVNVMVSIIKKASFNPKDMREAREMRRIARDQNLFSI